MPASAEIKAHWDRVAEQRCCITGDFATISHCHGGSMIDCLGYDWSPGMAQKQNHWLVLPICARLHTGAWGIDGGMLTVAEWELIWGTQMRHLEELCRQLGYSVFEKAGVEWPGLILERS